MSYIKVAKVIKSFEGTPPRDSPHFVVRYGVRNPLSGPGHGVHGIRDQRLVDRYLEGLERQYHKLISPPFSRPGPAVEGDGKTHVYIVDFLSLFGALEGRTLKEGSAPPYILLPCRTARATLNEELRWAEATAAHEATHVFNLSVNATNGWKWLDEGMAVFMEKEAYGRNPEYLSFGLEWTDRPDFPVDHDAVNYQAFLFVRYLVDRLKKGFLSKLWSGANGTFATAIEALDSLVPKKLKGLPFADATKPDLFASGYCMDSYFTWHTTGFARDVHARHRERAISDSFELKPGETRSATGVLWHLSCRYYRIRPAGGATAVRVELKSAGLFIKVEAAGATASGKSGNAIQLLLGQPEPLVFDGLDHIALVVTNCGIKGATNGPPSDPEDLQAYSVSVCGL